MKEILWKKYDFDSLFVKISGKKYQIKKSEYCNSGKYPIIDQGKKKIVAYTNNKNLFKDIPIIIFGDHTKIIKYIDFPFVIGADGTNLLKTTDICILQLGYYLLCNLKLSNLGYSRHYKLLKECDFNIPINKKEQKKITKILSTWDEAIEKTEKLIEAKQKFKKGLMQKIFSITNYELRIMNKKNWKKVKFNEIFKSINRKNIRQITHVLTASGEHGLIDQTEFFNKSVAGKNLKTYYLLKQGEFAYNHSIMKGYPYGSIKRLEKYKEGALSTLYICFALISEECDSDFYTHYFESGFLNKELKLITQVGARSHGLLNLSTRDFYSMNILKPSLEIQKKVSSILNASDKEIELLKKKLNKLQKQKKGLMQVLLTGNIRVKY